MSAILARFRLGRLVLRAAGRLRGINSMLGLLGVAIGVANIIALISVTQAGNQQALSLLREVGADTLFVLPFAGDSDGALQRASASAWLPAASDDLIERLPEIDKVASVMMMPGHVGSGERRIFTTIQAVDADYLDVRAHKVDKGRWITREESESGALVCTIGSMLPRDLFEPGADPVGQTVVLKGKRFTVIGVMVEKGMMGFETIDNRVFIPIRVGRELYRIDGSSSLMARAAAGVDIHAAQDAAEAALRAQAGLQPGEPADFSINTVDDLTGIVTSVVRVFTVLLFGIGSVALLVAGIGIMNVMLMQVIERTREIGVRRAVGARRRDIMRQFLLQALAQALAGALLGSVIGVAASVSFCLALRWRPYLELGVFALAAGFSIVICVAFGIYPALYAARLKPIDCLRYE